MEGVVMVEMSSGSLHYTKSFSAAFDERHPKTERLNLGALIFALHNFAGISTRRTDCKKGSNTMKVHTHGVADIVMFATSLEKMVLAMTPSEKFLVVLFTTPEFNTNVAKWVVTRVAFKYENTEMERVDGLNQVPRRFRFAFSQAVDDAVERELIHLGELLLTSEESENEIDEGDEEMLCFYYSPRLEVSDDNSNETGIKSARSTSLDDDKEEFRKAVNPTQSEISRNCLCYRVMTSCTRFFGKHSYCKSVMKKQKPRWKPRNAIMNYCEQHEFKRFVQLNRHKKTLALMSSHSAGSIIANVILPFLEVLRLSRNTPFPKFQEQSQLYHVVWRNVPGAPGHNLIAWRCGSCCIFYMLATNLMDRDNQIRIRSAIADMFDVIKPLLKAKATIPV